MEKHFMKVKVVQLCPTLCDPVYSIVHDILQARILEWVPFPFSRGSSQPRDWTQVSCIADGFLTSWATKEARIARGYEYIFFQKHTDGQEAREMMLMITNHQGNANQTAISPHLSKWLL